MAFTPRRLRVFSAPFLWVFLLALLVLSRFFPPIAHFQDSFLHQVFSPVLSFLSRSVDQVEDWGSHYLFLVGASEENRHLKAELSQLKIQLRDLNEEKSSFERERALWNFSQKYSTSYKMARVIAYDSLSSSRSFMVDRGSREGIQKGQGVMTPEGVVGVVVKTTPATSVVLLLTDPHSAIDGEVRPNGARGVLRGEKKSLGLNRDYWLTRMEYLEATQEVHEKDIVVTSGLDQVFPSGLPLGKVEKVIKDNQGLFLKAFVLPEVDFSKVKEVLVIQK